MSIESIAKHPATRAAAAFAAVVLLSGCPSPKNRDGQPTPPRTSTSAAPSPSPSPTGLEFPPPNLTKRPGYLVPCFAGNIALPERQPPADHLELSPNAQGYFTGQPRPNQAQMQTLAAATVEVRYDLSNGTHAEGSGVVVGDRVLTAAHVVYGQQLSKITVVDNNGNSHTVKDGCFVYQRNGERTPLNRTSQDRVTSVNDDLAVLRLNDRVPTAGLTLGNTAGYGEPVFVAGSPVPQNQRSKVFLAGVAVSGRDNTFAATALLGGEQNTAGPGVSGGALVTTDLLLAGIYNSSGTMEGPSLGANFGVSSSATELQIASYTGAEICQAAIAAQQAQVRAS